MPAILGVPLPLPALFLAAVIGISDGDTLTVLRDQQPVKIRLAEIDSPEKKQPFGTRSRQALSDLCYGVQAEVRPVTRDRYGRTVAHITCKGIDASREQVRVGMAWVYDRYNSDRALYELQTKAQAGKVGLWADPQPVAPWEYRRR